MTWRGRWRRTRNGATTPGRRPRKILLAIGALLGASILLLSVAPTPVVEKIADGQASAVVPCGKLVGLKVHLHSWPVIWRVLAGTRLGADGHVDEVTTGTYSVHDVSFTARSVRVNRSALLGGNPQAFVSGLVATATVTTADLTRIVRSLSHLPVELTAEQNGRLDARLKLALMTVSVPVTIALRGANVEVSAALPVASTMRLRVSPPKGIQLQSLSTQRNGLHVTAALQSVDTRTVLCRGLTGAGQGKVAS